MIYIIFLLWTEGGIVPLFEARLLLRKSETHSKLFCMPFIHSCNSYILQLFTCIIYWEIPKSHIGCLNPWSAAYISVGQLHLMPIGFKMKSNILWMALRASNPKRTFSTTDYFSDTIF